MGVSSDRQNGKNENAEIKRGFIVSAKNECAEKIIVLKELWNFLTIVTNFFFFVG